MEIIINEQAAGLGTTSLVINSNASSMVFD
jgi:hypothetical protein